MNTPRPYGAAGRLPAKTDPNWRLQLGILAVLAALTTLVFWNSDLDLRAAGAFYQPESPDGPWPGEGRTLWQFFYYGAPIFTALMALGALVGMLLGFLRNRYQPWRRPAALFLLTLVLGPGLLINVVFKENWGRPRPRQVEQFTGDRQYLPPLQMAGNKDGKSFPAGHASVGFSLFALWFVWRRRHPRLAWAFFGIAALLGTTMGLGRMEAGAHFLSDVLWAGYLTFFAALLSHYFLLPESPLPEIRKAGRGSPLPLIAYTVLGGTLLMGSLVSMPVKREIDFRPAAEDLPLPPELLIELDRAQLHIRLLPPGAQRPLAVSGSIRGFGLPTFDIQEDGTLRSDSPPRYRYLLRQHGFFIELDTRLTVELSDEQLRLLRVTLLEGDIRVSREPGAITPELDLHTEKGRLIPPAAD